MEKREGETPERKRKESDADREERRIGGIREEECVCGIEGVVPSCVDAKRIKFKAVNN